MNVYRRVKSRPLTNSPGSRNAIQFVFLWFRVVNQGVAYREQLNSLLHDPVNDLVNPRCSAGYSKGS